MFIQTNILILSLLLAPFTQLYLCFLFRYVFEFRSHSFSCCCTHIVRSILIGVLFLQYLPFFSGKTDGEGEQQKFSVDGCDLVSFRTEFVNVNIILAFDFPCVWSTMNLFIEFIVLSFYHPLYGTIPHPSTHAYANMRTFCSYLIASRISYRLMGPSKYGRQSA